MTKEQQDEWLTCAESFLYFCGNYVQIYDAASGQWVPFELWRAQVGVARTLLINLLVVILKARQIGLTWLVLAFALWLMIFHPAATVLLFSKGEKEAIELLDFRLKGMYVRLPKWMQSERVIVDNKQEWQLSCGSRALSFSNHGGRSYTGTIAIVDEGDFGLDLAGLMSAVQPTIDAGGRMIVLSSANKLTPLSHFKNLFRAAWSRTVKWVAVFLAWDAAPWRTEEWLAEKKADALRIDATLDNFLKEYPATWQEALSPATHDKRIPFEWLNHCYAERAAIPANALPPNAPNIEGLKIFCLPDTDRKYIIGADPAEGNPTSDDSALEVLEYASGEQVATLAGKFQPEIFADHINSIGDFFSHAHVLVERNNHGHTVLSQLREHSELMRLKGHDGKEGWHTTAYSKARMYDETTTAFRKGDTLVHDAETFTQLSLIGGASLEAPVGMLDDRATAFALAHVGRNRKYTSLGEVSSEAERQANKWQVDKGDERQTTDDERETSRWRIG